MSVTPHLRVVTAADVKRETRSAGDASRLEFAVVYRENVGPVTAFFARRCREPQEVADLASQTFVEAIRSAHTFEGRGTPRAWLFAIARTVYARHCADRVASSEMIDQLGGQLVLAHDELEDLAARIDAQHDGRELLARAQALSQVERDVFELVDLTGLTPKEAARVLGVSPNAVRVRLFRAHSRLRKEMQR